jgi:hypothetical protein
LPGFNRLRMQHTQLKPIPHPPHISNPTTIQQFAYAGAGQQGTITAADNGGSNNIPVAFVEFRDTQCAGQAMQLLQGKYLLSSDRGAMRIEFAKSKMAASEHLMASFQPTAILNGHTRIINQTPLY